MSNETNSEYWIRRWIDLEILLERRTDRAIVKMNSAYQKALARIEKDILAWYVRYATENGITLKEAKRILSARELAEFKWTVEEYIARGREYGISGAWAKELERASVRVHVSRLEALRMQLLSEAELFIGAQHSIISDCLEDTFKEGYYRSIFEINRKYSIPSDFATINRNKLHLVLSKPWNSDGLNFSERIWGNQRARLVGTLQNEMMYQIVAGRHSREMAKVIQDRFGVSKRSAERIARTESAAISEKAHQMAYNAIGVKYFQVIGTLDKRTCKHCAFMDMNIYPMSDSIIGTTAPPFHVNCRCTTAPYVKIDGLEYGERIGRKNGDPKQTWIDIPGNMKYPEWYEKYVEKN